METHICARQIDYGSIQNISTNHGHVVVCRASAVDLLGLAIRSLRPGVFNISMPKLGEKDGRRLSQLAGKRSPVLPGTPIYGRYVCLYVFT